MRFSRVIYPLMPKGVEHSTDERFSINGGLVIYPLMPKGVEHRTLTRPLMLDSDCDLSVDAERR